MGEDERTPIGAMEITLAVVVILACSSALAFSSISGPRGAATVTRALLALVGIAGAVLLLKRRPQWIILLGGWAALQIPMIIVDPSGALTTQGLHAGMSWVKSMSVNGRPVSAHGYGFNLVGVLFLAWIFFVHWKQKARDVFAVRDLPSRRERRRLRSRDRSRSRR